MNAPLRIAFFVGAFPLPSETFILRQITGLLDLGHDVHIFANARGDDGVVHESFLRYDLLKRTTFVDGPPESIIWEMPVRPVSGQTWLPGAKQPISNFARLAHGFCVLKQCGEIAPKLTRDVLNAEKFGYRATSWSNAYRLATLLSSSRKFDVLHAHFGPVANAFRFARDLFNAPFIVSFHGYDFCSVPRKEGRGVYRDLWQGVDQVIANSSYTREQLLALDCPIQKLSILPVGLDPTQFPFREPSLVEGEIVRLLTIARLVEIKGHEFVLRALAELGSAGVHVRYDVIGDGPLRQKLKALTSELGLNKIVTFHGSRSEAEVREFLARSHIFVLTSVNVGGDAEGQGLVLQEAQACGLPVVATRHGAFPEGIAPENDWLLVPERDPAAIAARLREVIAKHDQWPVIGRIGRRFVEQRYDIRDLNQKLVEIYRGATADFRA